MISRTEMKERAKTLLEKERLSVIVAMLIVFGITAFASAFVANVFAPASIAVSLCSFPLMVGLCSFVLKVQRGEEHSYKDLFAFYTKEHFNTVTMGMIMMEAFVLLWSLLLIVPGIVKAYEYAMVPFILAENPDMQWKDVLARSSEMMKGNKWRFFVFLLSFLGWILLGELTCGVVLVYHALPYMALSTAVFYDAIKSEQQ